MTKCHVSVKDTSQTIEEAGKTHWVCSSPPPSLVSTSSKPPGPGWGAVVKLLLANQVSVFFVQQNQRLKFDIHLLMASTFNPNGPLSSGSQGLTYFFHQQHLYINSKHSSVNPIWPGSFWCIRDPLNIFGLGGVRVLLFGNDFPRHDLPYSKDSWSLDGKNPPKKCLTFETLVRQRGIWPVRKGPPLWNFGISDK